MALLALWRGYCYAGWLLNVRGIIVLVTHERFIDNPCERFLLIFIIFEILDYSKKGLDEYPASQKGNVSYRATSLTDVGATVVVRLVVHEQHVSKRHSQDRLLARASMVQVQNNRKPSDWIFFSFHGKFIHGRSG